MEKPEMVGADTVGGNVPEDRPLPPLTRA